MDTSDLLKRAWEAVEKSGVPEPLQEVAFHEAVEHLRVEDESGPSESQTKRQDRRKRKKLTTPREQQDADGDGAAAEDDDTFFKRLADESGVAETDLRDVLSLAGNTVRVDPPSRKLGSSTAERARTVISLVAGARAYGLNERPVDAGAVREELQRKNVYDSGNFSSTHLGPLEGFNAGANRTEIKPTSKWDRDFSAAVEQALGRNKDQNGD